MPASWEGGDPCDCQGWGALFIPTEAVLDMLSGTLSIPIITAFHLQGIRILDANYYKAKAKYS